jgi:hypothetical protein
VVINYHHLEYRIKLAECRVLGTFFESGKSGQQRGARRPRRSTLSAGTVNPAPKINVTGLPGYAPDTEPHGRGDSIPQESAVALRVRLPPVPYGNVVSFSINGAAYAAKSEVIPKGEGGFCEFYSSVGNRISNRMELSYYSLHPFGASYSF